MISDSTPPSPHGSPSTSAAGDIVRQPKTRKISGKDINTAFSQTLTATKIEDVSEKNKEILVDFFRHQASQQTWLADQNNAEMCDKLMRAITRLYILSDTQAFSHQQDKTSQAIDKILTQHYSYLAPKAPADLTLLTDKDTTVEASALLLMHGSKTIEKTLTGNFEEGKRLFEHYPVLIGSSPVAIAIHGVSANALLTLGTFLRTGQLQHEHSFTAEELQELIRDIPYWELSDPNQKAELQHLLLEQITTHHLTPETALEWYGDAIAPTVDWPELRNACLNALSTLHTADELEELERAVTDSIEDPLQRKSLLRSVIQQATVHFDETAPDEKRRLYRLLSAYGTEEQVATCVASIMGKPSDAALLAAFGEAGPPAIEGVEQMHINAYHKRLLSERLRHWTLTLGNWNGDANSAILKGRKSGMLEPRAPLNQEAKAYLETFTGLHSHLIDASVTNALSPQLLAWYHRHHQ